MCTSQFEKWERAMVVGSNIAFLIEPIDLLILYLNPPIEHQLFRPSEIILGIISMVITCLFSSLYHACDTNYSRMECYQYCVLDWHTLHTLDLLGSYQSAIMTMLHCIPLNLCFFREILFMISPFILIIMINATLPLGIWPLTIFLMIIIGLKRIHSHWISIKVFPWYWALFTSGCLCIALLFEKAKLIADSYYYVTHSLWHIFIGFAMFSGCRFFRKIMVNDNLENKNFKVRSTESCIPSISSGEI